MYPFEGIEVDEAISNFREILAFANANREKVTLRKRGGFFDNHGIFLLTILGIFLACSKKSH